MSKSKKLSAQDHWLKIKGRWAKAERGKDGLLRVKHYDFESVPCHKISEVLFEPTVLVCDGGDVCVVMSIEDYFSRHLSNPKGRLVRVEGVLYREVI